MQVHFAAQSAAFRPKMQGIGLHGANHGIQKLVKQMNAQLAGKPTQDTLELSQKAQDLLKAQKQAQQPQEPVSGYQKHSSAISKEEWARNAAAEQRNGIKTVSDALDYAKSKLELTMGKIKELEDFLSGKAAHSDPNMTKELAESHLANYKQSIQQDYSQLVEGALGMHKSNFEEYSALSGGLASQMTQNHIGSLTADGLGLSNLSGKPEDILKALDKASEQLKAMDSKIQQDFAAANGGQALNQPLQSSSIFNGKSSLDFFVSQMEKPHMVIDTPLKFNRSVLTL